MQFKFYQAVSCSYFVTGSVMNIEHFGISLQHSIDLHILIQVEFFHPQYRHILRIQVYTDVCFREQRFLQRARLYTILPFGKAGRDKNEYFTANKLQRLFIWHLFCIGKISNVLMWKVWFKRLQRKGTIIQQICWETGEPAINHRMRRLSQEQHWWLTYSLYADCLQVSNNWIVGKLLASCPINE